MWISEAVPTVSRRLQEPEVPEESAGVTLPVGFVSSVHLPIGWLIYLASDWLIRHHASLLPSGKVGMKPRDGTCTPPPTITHNKEGKSFVCLDLQLDHEVVYK